MEQSNVLPTSFRRFAEKLAAGFVPGTPARVRAGIAVALTLSIVTSSRHPTALYASGTAVIPGRKPPAPTTLSKTQNVLPEKLRWWKGNLHTHTIWSDGDEFPEMVAEWYKTRGYHFVVFSSHNAFLHRSDKWLNLDTKPGAAAAFAAYRRRFGDTGVEKRLWEGRPQVRLKPLAEFRKRFEDSNRFLCIAGEEITDTVGDKQVPVHMNVINLMSLIRPQGGVTVVEALRRNIGAVRRAQQAQRGHPLMVQVNHPNYGWAVRAEDIADTRGIRFFEVFNGHPKVHNAGDSTHPDTDHIWDKALARRLAHGNREPLYGVAVDDSHKYHNVQGKGAQPGRGWVMVQAKQLSPEALIAAMERGQFYSSTGVSLQNVDWSGHRLSLRILPSPGVTYKTLFIGTCKGPARGSTLQIGRVLAESAGTSPSYTARGDELYVRAKIISSRLRPDQVLVRRLETAWTQPIFR